MTASTHIKKLEVAMTTQLVVLSFHFGANIPWKKSKKKCMKKSTEDRKNFFETTIHLLFSLFLFHSLSPTKCKA